MFYSYFSLHSDKKLFFFPLIKSLLLLKLPPQGPVFMNKNQIGTARINFYNKHKVTFA